MSGKSIALLATFLVVIDVALPYAFFRDSATFCGAFALWTILPAAAIVVAAFVTRSWRNGA